MSKNKYETKTITVSGNGRLNGQVPAVYDVIKYEGNFFFKEDIGILPIKTTKWIVKEHQASFAAQIERDENSEIITLTLSCSWGTGKYKFVLAGREKPIADTKRWFFQCCGWRDQDQHATTCKGLTLHV